MNNDETMHKIKTLRELLTLYKQPLATSVNKETPVINDAYRKLIRCSPFLTIASVGEQGMDCSPRGDHPGFVEIISDKQIAIPDRRGNNRLDTLKNIVVDPRVALLLMIPGYNETLRINGRAHISVEPRLLQKMAVDNRQPVTAIVITVDALYFQCARALKRSGLWRSENHVDRKTLPTAGELIKSVVHEFDDEKYDNDLPDRQAKTLY
jgi:uncharacterized protein